MRKEYRKILRREFKRQLKEIAPEFEEDKTGSTYVFPGETVFRWTISTAVSCFIILLPSRKGHNEFTIEVGWSKRGRFPELFIRPSPELPNEEQKEFALDEYILRMGDLSADMKDLWWKVGHEDDLDILNLDLMEYVSELKKPVPEEVAEDRIKPKLDEAMEMLKTFGLPYLKRFSEEALEKEQRTD